MKVVAVVIALLFVTSPAWAILDLVVQEDLAVYQKPNKKSRKISRLGRGDRVVVSPKKYGAFKKVLITYKGKKRGGYILKKDIRQSVIVERGSAHDFQGEMISVYNWPYRVGFTVAGSHMLQGQREVTTSNSEVYELSELESSQAYFAVNLAVASSDTFAWRASLIKRNTQFSGRGQLQGVSQQSGGVVVNQELVGLGILLKWYSASTNRFWYGVQGELSKVTSVDITVNDGDVLDTSEVELPFYLMVAGSAGWDFRLFSDLFLTPEVRLGVVTNSDPYTLNAELLMNLGYSFK